MKETNSLARHQGFGVAASPFNSVKLDIATLGLGGIVLFLAQELWLSSLMWQLALLLGYGAFSLGWIIWRTRKVMQQALKDRAHVSQ